MPTVIWVLIPIVMTALQTSVPRTVVNITKNIAPFGTGEWLVENLRFPTYPNLRYAGVNDDEKPVAGAFYTQFAFEYVSPSRGLHGQGTVGQALVSVTHHVFYVLDSFCLLYTSRCV